MVEAFFKAKYFFSIPDITYVYRKEHRTTKQTFNNKKKILDAFEGMNYLLNFAMKNNLEKLHHFVLNQQKEHIVSLVNELEKVHSDHNLNILNMLKKLWRS